MNEMFTSTALLVWVPASMAQLPSSALITCCSFHIKCEMKAARNTVNVTRNLDKMLHDYMPGLGL